MTPIWIEAYISAIYTYTHTHIYTEDPILQYAYPYRLVWSSEQTPFWGSRVDTCLKVWFRKAQSYDTRSLRHKESKNVPASLSAEMSCAISARYLFLHQSLTPPQASCCVVSEVLLQKIKKTRTVLPFGMQMVSHALVTMEMAQRHSLFSPLPTTLFN